MKLSEIKCPKCGVDNCTVMANRAGQTTYQCPSCGHIFSVLWIEGTPVGYYSKKNKGGKAHA